VGRAGLARKRRSDRGQRHLSDALRRGLEGLALKKPPLSAASIHRQAVTRAERLGQPPPSYSTVYALIRVRDPAVLTLVQEGTRAHADAFDLIRRHEAAGPNAVWQAVRRGRVRRVRPSSRRRNTAGSARSATPIAASATAGSATGRPGSARRCRPRPYADWDRVASADPYAGRGAFRSDEVPGHGCVLYTYTATVVNSPR
jgi:hypothetical protein